MAELSPDTIRRGQGLGRCLEESSEDRRVHGRCPQELWVLHVEAWSPGGLRGREKGLGRRGGLFAMTNGRRGQAGLHEGK